MKIKNSTEYAINLLPSRVREILTQLSPEIMNTAYEIRLRENRPLTLFGKYGTVFIDEKGICSSKFSDSSIIISKDEINECFGRICEFSVHSHQKDINNGFVTTDFGNRVGICGTAVCENGVIRSIRDITSLNIRIAKEFFGCADGLINDFNGESLIIAGPPNSGKTTVLRDFARQLSNGKTGRYIKTAVIDERREISAKFGGQIINDLGITCDVLDSYPKKDAIDIAVRTLSPEFIICDEISTLEEIESIKRGINCGVKFAVTVHAGSIDEILHRRQIEELIDTYSFRKLYLLDNSDNIGRIKAEYDIGELRNEIYRCRIGFDNVYTDRAENVG
ncbi:MAG: stage III sporulation protein AA [Ruminococcaceae bacterium]|nr:stage III sporulation protein AA [Oscillospiraceae bacterium]MBQ6874070.1 TniB family NTP-binding protein [Clostridia bacterium]